MQHFVFAHVEHDVSVVLAAQDAPPDDDDAPPSPLLLPPPKRPPLPPLLLLVDVPVPVEVPLHATAARAVIAKNTVTPRP